MSNLKNNVYNIKNRTILKPVIPKKYHSHERYHTMSSNEMPNNRGVKNKYSSEEDEPSSKRFKSTECFGSSSTPKPCKPNFTSNKNIANKRLQQFRQKLQDNIKKSDDEPVSSSSKNIHFNDSIDTKKDRNDMYNSPNKSFSHGNDTYTSKNEKYELKNNYDLKNKTYNLKDSKYNSECDTWKNNQRFDSECDTWKNNQRFDSKSDRNYRKTERYNPISERLNKKKYNPKNETHDFKTKTHESTETHNSQNKKNELKNKFKSPKNKFYNTKNETFSPKVETFSVPSNSALSSDTEDYNKSNYMDDSMDWSPITEEEINQNVTQVRKEIDFKKNSNDDFPQYCLNQSINTQTYQQCSTSQQSLLLENKPQFSNLQSPNLSFTNQSTSDGVFIVIDTNIFLAHLDFISSLKDKTFKDLGQAIIVIPWMVLQELDYMKDGRSNSSALKSQAKKAVSFINNILSQNHPNFRGQTVVEASLSNHESNNPDDGILNCCLQYLEKNKKVVLLSHDKNLQNKALVNKIPAYNKNDLIDKLNSYSLQSEQDEYYIVHISRNLGNLLTNIVENELLEAYGNIWMKMACVVPPLTVMESISLMQKYWTAVFSFNLLKQCKQCIDEFHNFLKNLKNNETVTKTIQDKYIEYSLRLCVYLKNGYKKYRQDINSAIEAITKCGK